MSYFDILAARAGAGGGAPTPQPVLIEKSVTENGTYTALEDEADGYSSVSVEVPNTYSASDEGKVVSNGTLVAQSSDTVTANNTYDTTLINSLTVNVPSSGGGGAPESDVNFRDYDGTIVASYSAADFASLAALPENPTHDGLTAQGWNWTLADAKAYVVKYGNLEIGQMYTTADGKTHIHIVLEDGRLEPVLGLGVNGSVDIDWGDGSEHTTLTGTNVSIYVSTSPHTYSAAGEYTIKLTVTGSMAFVSKNNVCGLLMKDGFNADQSKCYINTIKSVNIGGSVTAIGSNAFRVCYSLRSVTIPEGVTAIGNKAFYDCYSISSITIPEGVTTVQGSAFYDCYSLSSITMPEGVTNIGDSAFYNCKSLGSITMPESVTNIGDSAFYSCNFLSSITIPEGVTAIQSNAFQYCYSLSSITIPEGVTAIQSYICQYCYSLRSVTIPEGVTAIQGGAFQGCYSLSSITIPESVTVIGSNTFQYCLSLSSITIPEGVTAIQSNAFQYCHGFGKITFKRSRPATASSGAFSNISIDCKIYVPQGSLSAYTSAQNYPSSSTYTYIEY